MQHDVHVAVHGARQSGDAGEVSHRRAADRCRIEHAVPNHAKTARALGHEHRPVGQEREAPGELELVGDDRDLDVLAFRRVVEHRLRRQRPLDEARGRDRNAVVERHLLLAEQA